MVVFCCRVSSVVMMIRCVVIGDALLQVINGKSTILRKCYGDDDDVIVAVVAFVKHIYRNQRFYFEKVS